MIKARGYAALAAKKPLEPYDFQRRDVGAQDVLIDIQYCGICHSDIHQVREEWGTALFPMVPGHEIVGVVKAIGSAVTQYQVGDKVGVGCIVDSCRQCENCQDALEQFCDLGMVPTYNGKERKTGMITQGGYSNQIVVDENYVLRIPESLPFAACAPLLCAGITLYSPLKHWQAGPGKKVAILGLGGLGHMGVKIAHAMGAEVTVLSHTSTKEQEAKRMGADHFYDTSDFQTFKKLAKYFDLIINTVSANIPWNQYLQLLKRDGTLVIVGIPEEQIPINAMALVDRRRRLAGSLIGGIKETQEMLDFCAQHQISSEIEMIGIDQVNRAYERVLKSDVRYRFVIDLATLPE